MNTPNFPKLKGRENYQTWVVSAKSYLTVKDLWQYTQSTPSESADAAVVLKHEKTLAELTLLIEPRCYSYIEGAANPKAAWDMINKTFSDNGVARHSQILQDLVTMRRSKCSSMEDYVEKMTVLYQKTKSCGFEIGENVVASLMLGGLSDEYKPLMYGVGKDSKNLTLDFVQNLLLQEIDSNIEQCDETALAAGSKRFPQKKKKIKCFNCGGNHFAKNCKKERKYEKKSDKPSHTVLCAKINDSDSESECEYDFESVFYYQNDCVDDTEYNPNDSNDHSEEIPVHEKREESASDDHSDEIVQIMTIGDPNDFVHEACNISTFFVGADKKEWILDSGATAHMCNDEFEIKNARAPQKRKVVIANNETIEIKNVGSVDECIILNGQKSVIRIDDVHCIPDICANLLSVSKLVKKNYEVIFNAAGAKIYDEKKKLIATASMVNDLFKLDTGTENVHVAFVSEAILWHKRLGHVSVSNMNFLKKSVKGIEIPPSMPCEVCTQGKQTRLPFKNNGTRAVSLLQIVHSDVCGPMSVSSIGGAKYYVSFIDDFSRKYFVYIIKQKSQVFECFQKFKALVENQTDKKIKIFRSDGGGEFDNKQFTDLCEREGIMHQKTAPYTPQQNGMSERANRTIMEKVRCMLYGAKLSKGFWAEAVKYAVDVINSLPNSANRQKCPDEIWFGYAPNMNKFKVFGCKAYAHVPNQKRTKLEMKSSKCIFIGFPENTKAYKLYNKSTKKVVISRDVVFFEENESDAQEQQMVQLNDDFDSFESFPMDSGMSETTEPGGVMHQQIENDDDENGADVSVQEVQTENSDAALTEDANSDDESVINQFDDAHDESILASPVDDHRRDPSYNDRASDPNTERARTRGFNPFGVFSSHVALIAIPKTAKEAFDSPEANEWKNAMELEMKSLRENETWELTELPRENKTVKCKWVFSTKTDEMGNILRFKARLVARGFSQEYGIDYTETFSPVVKYTTIRFVLALAAARNLKVTQMDAVTAYLNGNMKETIYMDQPLFFDDKTGRVCKLKKSIYGLKQSGKNWNDTLNAFLLNIGLSRCGADQCLYFSSQNDKTIIVLIWVDDFIIVTSDESDEKWLVDQLSKRFKMKYLGVASKILGMRVTIGRDGIKLDQEKHVIDILDKFGMTNCNAVSTPMEIGKKISKEMSPTTPEEIEEMKNVPYREAIGCLQFLCQVTRPDITFAVNIFSRYCNDPGQQHWAGVKRIIRYLKGTAKLGLRYSKTTDADTVGYCDADWAGDADGARSSTGYVFLRNETAISWATRKQPTVALSTTEAEHMSMVGAVQEAIWLRNLENELSGKSLKPTVIHCDNQGAMKLAKNNAFSPRTKHIHVKQQFLHEAVENGIVTLKYVNTNEMIADVLTKGLPREKHCGLIKKFGLSN